MENDGQLPPTEYFGANKFARVGISHITSNIAQHMEPKMKGRDWIHINTSSQPNSNPHFGTITTMMTVFAIAEELRGHFAVPVRVTFDQLENAPDRSAKGLMMRSFRGADVEYQISLRDSFNDRGESLVAQNMKAFNSLFNYLSAETGIEYRVRSYDECQQSPHFRRALLSMFQQPDIYTPIVAPDEGNMRLRFPCPECKWVDKGSVHTHAAETKKDSILFSAECPDHGTHTALLSAGSKDFLDTNTPLRDIAKGAALIEEARDERSLAVMVDGRDWSGRWNNLIFSEGITRLGYAFQDLPFRFYSPTITDRLGAKLSKSLYVGRDTYNYMPDGFMNYESFLATHGEKGLSKLWNHVRQWPKDPAFLDRDSYSIDYFRLLLNDQLPPAEVGLATPSLKTAARPTVP